MMPLFLTRIQPLFNSAKTSSSRLSVKVVIISESVDRYLLKFKFVVVITKSLFTLCS